jgi:hypothetical protein
VQDHRAVSKFHQGFGKGQSLALKHNYVSIQFEVLDRHKLQLRGRDTHQRAQTGTEPSDKNESCNRMVNLNERIDTWLQMEKSAPFMMMID